MIVDEIHAVADDKRGAHLALSLERLEALTRARAARVRIGLSATQKPIELVAQFLAGNGRAGPADRQHRPPARAGSGGGGPRSELGPVASNEMWEEIYDRMAELVRQHRSTLVFVNTRRLSERVAHHLAERLGEEAVAPHHGSLSRKLRLEAERQAEGGRAAGAGGHGFARTGHRHRHGGSGLPDRLAALHRRGLQRIGRSGHWRGAMPKGRLFATTRDELIECAALVRAMRQGELDRLEIPDAPLDILAQQIVAMCAAEEWKEDELFAAGAPGVSLPRSCRAAISTRSSQCCPRASPRAAAATARYLHRDQVNHRLRGRRGAAWRPSPTAARFRTTRTTRWSPSPKAPRWARWTKISPSKACAATSSAGQHFLAHPPRAEPAACAWRMRTGAPPTFRSGWRSAGAHRELSQQVAEMREKISEMTRGRRRRERLLKRHRPEAQAARRAG